MPTPLSVQQLLTPMTQAQFRASGVTLLQSLGLQPQKWVAGSVGSSLLTYSASILAQLSTALSNAIGSQWLPTAVTDGLQLLSYYVYGVTPPVGTYATGTLTLTNTGGGIWTYAAGQAVFASSVAGPDGTFPTYTNVSAFTLSAFATLSIAIVCATLGSAGNASPGNVSVMVTAMLGVSCNNVDPVIGLDPISDSALRQLDLNSIAARSVFGPKGAYATAIALATNTVTGNPVNINRSTIALASHTGVISVVVAGPDGTTDPNDLAGVILAINNLALAMGATPVVTAATAVPYSPTFTAYVRAPIGTSATALQSAMALAIASFMGSPSNPIGGVTVYDPRVGAPFTGLQFATVAAQIALAVATAVPGAFLLSLQTSGAPGDLPLSPGQVATDEVTVAVPVVTFAGS